MICQIGRPLIAQEIYVRIPLLVLLAAVLRADAAVVNGAGDVDIYYTREGSGDPAIVFVHGWTCDSSYWRHQTGEFSKDHTVVSLDLAGHGESGSNRGDWSMAAFGEDVAAVVEAEGLDDVILVGHSMGGAVIIEAARRLGNRVKQVVAIDTLQEPAREPYSESASKELWAPFAQDFSTAIEGFVRNSFFLPTAPPDVVDWVAKDMASADAGIALAAGHKLTTWDTRDGIREIANTPFVLINADYRPTDAEGLASLHPDARLILLEDVGHFPMLVVPDAFNDVLRAVIELVP
jgi:pimeloyl-ACP methyl ester carboxylesterase